MTTILVSLAVLYFLLRMFVYPILMVQTRQSKQSIVKHSFTKEWLNIVLLTIPEGFGLEVYTPFHFCLCCMLATFGIYLWPSNHLLVYTYRVKNYYWPLAVFRPKLPNGQPLSKVVGRLGQPSVKIVKAS